MLVKERGERRGHNQNKPDFRPDYAKVGDWIFVAGQSQPFKIKAMGGELEWQAEQLVATTMARNTDPIIVVPSHPRVVFKVRFEYDDYVTIPSLIPSSIRDGFNSTKVKDLQYLYQVKEVECWDRDRFLLNRYPVGLPSFQWAWKYYGEREGEEPWLVLANVEGYFNSDFRRWEPAVPDHEIEDAGFGDEFGRDLWKSAPMQWALVHTDDWNEGFTAYEDEGEIEDEFVGDGGGGDDGDGHNDVNDGDDDDEDDGDGDEGDEDEEVDGDGMDEDDSDEDDSSGNYYHAAGSITITSEQDADSNSSSSTERGSNGSTTRSNSTAEMGSVGTDTSSRTIMGDDSRAGSTNTVNTFTLALRGAASFKKRKSADDHHGGGGGDSDDDDGNGNIVKNKRLRK
ncbi:hypothetical protein HRR78_001717 [Exophiala dermatitidis]|nr:hypothetical protein HRR78_001717 [Exophiala dermatitidis]